MIKRLKTLKFTASFVSLVSRFHNLDPSYFNDRLPYLTVLGFGTISFIWDVATVILSCSMYRVVQIKGVRSSYNLHLSGLLRT